MKKNIYIVGARMDGHAGVVFDTIRMENNYEIIGFIDNTPSLIGKKINGIEVICSSECIKNYKFQTKNFHIAIGDNVARKKISKMIKDIKGNLITIIHPNSIISSSVKIKEGSFVGPLSVLNFNTKIGKCCIINSGSIIEHDNLIEDFVHMAPSTATAGRVIVEELSFIGVGATILPDLKIGKASIVGAGSVVVKNVQSKETVIGYAAQKYIRKNIYEK